MAMRDNQTDTKSGAEVAFTMDFSPSTLEDVAAHNGSTRANAPVGAPGTNESYVNTFTSLRAMDEVPAVKKAISSKRW